MRELYVGGKSPCSLRANYVSLCDKVLRVNMQQFRLLKFNRGIRRFWM